MHELIINLKKEVILRGDWIQNVYAWDNNSGQYNYNMMFNKTNWGQNEKNRHEIKIKAKFCMIWNDTSYIGEQFQSFDNDRNSFEFEIKWILCMSTDVEEKLIKGTRWQKK